MRAKTSRGVLTVRLLGAVVVTAFAVLATSCASQVPTNYDPTSQPATQDGSAPQGNR